MQTLFSDLDDILDLPFPAFEKRLAKLEEEFKNISITDISEEELESYFTRIKSDFESFVGEKAKTRLALLWYLSHFDTFVEKYFPDYVTLFQTAWERADYEIIEPMSYDFLAHLDEIPREYTHRLSEPDQYPSYTGFIQELIQNSMIDLFFWLQERESILEKTSSEGDKNTDIHIVGSSQTKNKPLKFIRQCLELLNEGVLEKIFFDHEYPLRVSAVDPELQLIGRYMRKQ